MRPRSHPRHRIHAYAQFAGGDRPPVYSPIRNLSLGGACVQTGRRAHVGSRLCVHLMFPESQERVMLQGEVTWIGPARSHDVGIRWIDGSPEARSALGQCLRDVAAEAL